MTTTSWDEVTVYFGNDKSTSIPSSTGTAALVSKAKSFQGFMIEVKGDASSSGERKSEPEAQRRARAENVANFLI